MCLKDELCEASVETEGASWRVPYEARVVDCFVWAFPESLRRVVDSACVALDFRLLGGLGPKQ